MTINLSEIEGWIHFDEEDFTNYILDSGYRGIVNDYSDSKVIHDLSNLSGLVWFGAKIREKQNEKFLSE